MRRPFSRIQLRAAVAAVAALAGASTLGGSGLARADDTPVDYLQINSPHAQTFNDGDAQVIYIDGPVTIETDRVKLSAKSAVIWFTPVQGAALGRQRAEIALIGEATLVQDDITRTGERLFVSTIVGGPVRLSVQSRESVDLRGSPLYKIATDLRPAVLTGADVRNNILVAEPTPDDAPSTQPTTGPATMPSAKAPVFFSGGNVQTTRATPDGKIAVVLGGGVLLTQRQPNGDYMELQADQAVLFTTLTEFGDISGQMETVQDAVQSAYLEGDVRINFNPATRAGRQVGEQRLRAKRAFYEFNTNRAVLTKIVLQSSDPKVPFPITMRANVAKQLSLGEYKAEGVTLTTSQFAAPSYSINATRAYVRQYQDPDPTVGPRTSYEAKNASFRTFGVPIFWFPYAAGDIATNAYPLRSANIGSSRNSGFGVQTTWGLFESFGRAPPPGLDAQYHLDYYTDRGPATGFDAKYKGGELAQTTKDAWNFQGDFTAYLIKDHGTDNLGRDRQHALEPDENTRGRILWQHQQMLPQDWQTQFRVGLVSDPTFLEEFYHGEFDEGLPSNLSAYAKHQTGQEAVTLLVEYQPNDFVTTSNSLQNRFVGDRGANPNELGSLQDRPFEVDRLPEIGYYRLGESLDDDTLTLFSENRVGGYRMNEGSATLLDEGFQSGTKRNRYSNPGIPSLGYTGQSEDWVLRGDFRQEIDYPIDAGRFKVVPYVLGRYTGYSDSPQDDPENRLLGGVGARINTAFWNVDDGAESDFFY
ncbi:MAG: Organic solvent tolerance protein OstA, partial [Phycisphaerales bacterium]|nr:Organic solvent tolerance protein OstA [Phycisphaerales bacterium]